MIMKLFRMGIFSLLFLSLSACYTFEFSEGKAQSSSSADYSQWHHTALNGLIEISNPVHLKKYCKKGWKKVVVQKGILQSLTGGFQQYALPVFLFAINMPILSGVEFYAPTGLEIYCK